MSAAIWFAVGMCIFALVGIYWLAGFPGLVTGMVLLELGVFITLLLGRLNG